MKFIRKVLLVMIGVLLIGGSLSARDNCDIICKTLKNVSSPYSNSNLYDIVSMKKTLYNKLLEKGYKSDIAIKIIKYQPNNLGFHLFDALSQSAASVKDLYYNSITDGWTISKATFLQEIKLIDKAREIANVGELYKTYKKLSEQTKNFEMIIKGIVSANASLQIKGKTENFIKALDDLSKNHTLSIDDMKAILDYLDTVKKSLFINNSSASTYVTELTSMLVTLKQLEQYDQFKSFIKTNSKDIRLKLLTSKELVFIDNYYHIIKLKLGINFMNILAEAFKEKVVANYDLEDIMKSVGIAYKYLVGLPGIEPTFNQNFATYATNSIAIYKQDLDVFVNTYNQLKNNLSKLLFKYENGEYFDKKEINELVRLWNNYGNTNFSNYVVRRYLKQHKKILLENIMFTNVANNTVINLPLIGMLYNTTCDGIKNMTLQIWGKNGKNIINKKLSDSDIACGGLNNYSIDEIGDTSEYGIRIKINTNNAFYDKNGKFYYYKYALFDKNMNMIYTFLKQYDGGYVPGWNYADKNNKILLKDNGDISINNAFGIIPFYINDIEFKDNEKFKKFKEITNKNDEDLQNLYTSLIQYTRVVNKFNNDELSRWLNKRFAIDFDYAKNNIFNKDEYKVKDVLYIQLDILKYIYKNSKNINKKKRSENVLRWINKLYHDKHLVDKYGTDRILYKVYKMYNITSINIKNFNKPLKYGMLKDQLFAIYKYLRGASK